MALDGLLLNNIVHELSDLTPLRINRIAQISEYSQLIQQQTDFQLPTNPLFVTANQVIL